MNIVHHDLHEFFEAWGGRGVGVPDIMGGPKYYDTGIYHTSVK